MRNYICVQDASTAARSRSNGKIGEKLAEQALRANGFVNIENLNKTHANHKYADIYAEKDGVRYVISVKTRNKYTANGKLNPSYNLIQGGDAEFAKLAEDAKGAKAAWVAVVLEDVTFDAYFGLLSSLTSLTSARSIPMTPMATKNYLCLARSTPHDENPLEFKDQYRMNNDPVNPLSFSKSPSVSSDEGREQAKEAGRILAAHLQVHHSLRVQLIEGEGTNEAVELPIAVSRLLVDVLTQMGKGDVVTITSASAELTIQQAADLLYVSRPYRPAHGGANTVPHGRDTPPYPIP